MRSSRINLPILLLWLAAALAGCRWADSPPQTNGGAPRPDSDSRRPTPTADQLPFGNPSGAVADAAYPDNYLLAKRSFVVSYNQSRGTANWAAWRTTAADLGERLPRAEFRPDPDLPAAFRIVRPTDYSGSGYDRGHLVPSADRFADPGLNAETFLMTNIVPQAGELNRYPWAKLESYSRGVVRRGSDVYTFAGVYGEKQRLKGVVAVPTNCWKIIIVLPPGGTAEDIGKNTRVIAVDMPNIDGVEGTWWQDYLTTVRAIEEKTGYNFLSLLPSGLQDVLETRIDRQAGGRKRK